MPKQPDFYEKQVEEIELGGIKNIIAEYLSQIYKTRESIEQKGVIIDKINKLSYENRGKILDYILKLKDISEYKNCDDNSQLYFLAEGLLIKKEDLERFKLSACNLGSAVMYQTGPLSSQNQSRLPGMEERENFDLPKIEVIGGYIVKTSYILGSGKENITYQIIDSNTENLGNGRYKIELKGISKKGSRQYNTSENIILEYKGGQMIKVIDSVYQDRVLGIIPIRNLTQTSINQRYGNTIINEQTPFIEFDMQNFGTKIRLEFGINK